MISQIADAGFRLSAGRQAKSDIVIFSFFLSLKSFLMRKKFHKIFTVIFILIAVFAVAKMSHAQVNLGLEYGNAIGLSATDPRIIISRIIQIFLGFLGIIAIGLIIYGGFLWMTAVGNEERIDQAKRTLVSAIIGLVIILSAFGIATFILNQFLAATGAGSGQNNNGGGAPAVNGISGAGAVGVCSVQNVYPTPNQTVSRNSVILITFNEAVDPATICATVDVSGNCAQSAILPANVQIYKTGDSGNPLNDTKVSATADHKTFTFIPAALLDAVSYTVNLTGKVLRQSDHRNIFAGGAGCAGSFSWQFQVSNLIDLTPPQVISGGVFPPPDNGRDMPNNVLSKQASGLITVNSQPKYFSPATSTVSKTNADNTPAASVSFDPNIDSNATLYLVALQGTNGLSATLASDKGVSLGSANFNGRTVSFSGSYPFSLTAAADVVAGNAWTVNIKAAVPADSLQVGSSVYTFVKKSAAANQIAVAATAEALAANIVSALAAETDITAAIAAGSPQQVIVAAATAGAAGNSINLVFNSPADSGAINIVKMSGGSDGQSAATINDQPDQPMNTAIQINFNEPILPTAVVGKSSAVAAIQIVNAEAAGKAGDKCGLDSDCLSDKCAAGVCDGNSLAGTFSIANQYQTVEFVSDKQCGVNGCGEPIYCLPPDSNLAVKINAASLAPCSSAADCATKSPYNICSSVCKKSNGESYPLANIAALDGITDTALNSLDGNRDGIAQGPATYYNENTKAAGGDNYLWSFYVSDQLDTSAPLVVSTIPAPGQAPAVDEDIQINFNKLMMASTLITGSTVINNGQVDVTHKNINLWSVADNPVGYWIQTQTIFKNGSPVSTNAIIKHGTFGEADSYRAQAGSAIRDIHENCFKPSGDCLGVSESSPSCCNGTATAKLGPDGNCP